MRDTAKWERYDARPDAGVDAHRGVDRKANVIHGVAIATARYIEGGHNHDFDDVTLQQLIDQGNASKVGIKARYDHPQASAGSMGSHLGRYRNFTLDDTGPQKVARADLHLSKTSLSEQPGGGKPRGLYVMDLAEEDPSALGNSVAIKRKLVQRRHPDGSMMTDAAGAPLPLVARIERFRASDIVDTPAATDGMFSDTPAMEADALFERVGTDKAVAWVVRYARSKGLAEALLSALEDDTEPEGDEPEAKEEEMLPTTTTPAPAPVTPEKPAAEAELSADELRAQLAAKSSEATLSAAALEQALFAQKQIFIDAASKRGALEGPLLDMAGAYAASHSVEECEAYFAALPGRLHDKPTAQPGDAPKPGTDDAQLSADDLVMARQLGMSAAQYAAFASVERINHQGQFCGRDGNVIQFAARQ